jgi:hypothetical protein
VNVVTGEGVWLYDMPDIELVRKGGEVSSRQINKQGIHRVEESVLATWAAKFGARWCVSNDP